MFVNSIAWNITPISYSIFLISHKFDNSRLLNKYVLLNDPMFDDDFILA